MALLRMELSKHHTSFSDFPAEHWIHLRTTTPIESIFAPARHRTSGRRNCVSHATLLGLAFKRIQETEKSWRRSGDVERIHEWLAGTVFKEAGPANG